MAETSSPTQIDMFDGGGGVSDPMEYPTEPRPLSGSQTRLGDRGGKGAKRRFGTLPDAVVRDRALNAEGLVALAYRCVFRGAFRTLENVVCSAPHDDPPRPGICSGYSRDVYRRGRQCALDRMYLSRFQPRQRQPNGQFKFSVVVERLNLPPAPRGYRNVMREWFELNPRLPYQSLAALLFIRAGTGKGRGVFPREFEERFGWSRPATLKYLAELVERGLIEKVEMARPGGRFAGSYYVEAGSQKAPKTTALKIPATETAGDGDRGLLRNAEPITKNHKALPHDGTPTSRRAAPTLQMAEVLPPAAQDGSILAGDKLECAARREPILLGWIHANETASALADKVTDEDITELYCAMSDVELRERLVSATGDRLAPAILSPPGLFALRFMAAAFVTWHAPSVSAITAVLDRIDARIGRRKAQLNNLAVIGKALVGAAMKSDAAAARAGSDSQARRTWLDDVLDEIKRADVGLAISPKLYARPAPLKKMLEAHGVKVVEIITATLCRCLLTGTRINSWGYFKKAIASQSETFDTEGDPD